MNAPHKAGLRKDGVSMLRAIIQFVHYKLTHTAEERWWLVFMCICLSALFWTLRMLGKTYTITEPLTVEWNIRTDGLAAKRANVPPTVQASLTGMGWDLMIMRYHLRSQHPVLPGMVVGESFVVNPMQARQALGRQVPNVQVNFIAVPELQSL